MRVSPEELRALSVYAGGTDKAAEMLGVEEDLLESAIEGRKLPRSVEKEIERSYEDLEDEDADALDFAQRLGQLFEEYPDFVEIIDNDGVAQAFMDNPQMIDLFTFELTEKVIDTIIAHATLTKKGSRRQRQQSLENMVAALEADNFEVARVRERKDSKFWAWFRSIYPG